MVRSATAMVKKALLGALESDIIAAEELYNLDDQGLFALAAKREFPLFSLLDSVKNGRLFSMAAEIPFDEEAHKVLFSVSERSRMEEELAADISSEISGVLGKTLQAGELIIDLPEPISFECGLFINDENCFFSAGSTVFKGNTVDTLVKSLRIIRIFIDPRYEEKIKSCKEGILQRTKKWLKLYTGS
jgi:hypothetical protein